MAKSKNRRKKNYTTSKNTTMNYKSKMSINGHHIGFRVDNSLPSRSEKVENQIIKHSAAMTAVWMYMGEMSEDTQATAGYCNIAAMIHNTLYRNPKSTPLDFEAAYHRSNLIECVVSHRGMDNKSDIDLHTGNESAMWLLSNMGKVSSAFDGVEEILNGLEKTLVVLQLTDWDNDKAVEILKGDDYSINELFSKN